MSDGIASDNEPAPTADPGGSVPGSDRDEVLATKVTRGVAEGFAEASLAFSHEVAGSNHIAELAGRSAAGVIRASARLLDEVANVVRDTAEGFGSRSTVVVDVENVDYDRLASLITERLRADGVAAGPTGTA